MTTCKTGSEERTSRWIDLHRAAGIDAARAAASAGWRFVAKTYGARTVAGIWNSVERRSGELQGAHGSAADLVTVAARRCSGAAGR